MKSFKFLAAFAFVTVVSAIGMTGSVQAASECKIEKAVDGTSLTDLKNKSITQSGNKVTAKFIVSGDADCKKSASIATWKWYSRFGLPLNEQELYKTATGTFGPGTHTLTAEVPVCYWQADLVQGTRPTAADGTADYRFENGDLLMDAAFGGDGVCKKGGETPSAPQTPATDVSTITTLPSTGAGSVLATATVLGLGAGAAYSVIRRKQSAK